VNPALRWVGNSSTPKRIKGKLRLDIGLDVAGTLRTVYGGYNCFEEMSLKQSQELYWSRERARVEGVVE